MSAPGGLGSKGYLLVRRDGTLWGVDNADVESLTRAGAGYRIGMAETPLWVEEVLGVVADLLVRPVAPVLRRFWPDTAGGLAVHAERPLLILDPRRPPHALRIAEEGEE